jgi:hypothetical protein
MSLWRTACQRGLISGTTSSLLSTLALALLGQGANHSLFAPTNAISHWIWGDKAARRDDASTRYTLPGYLIHHASATFWAVLFERFFHTTLNRQDAASTLQAATAAAGVACFVDYQLTPRRLRPGYEMRLPKPALAIVYAAFAVGLAGGAIVCRKRPANDSI